MHASSPAREILLAKLRHRDPRSDRFVDELRQGHGDEIAAIVFYGSLLSEATGKPSSFADFYVIVDSLAAFHVRWRDRWVGRVLPPSVYFRDFGEGFRCKFCVLTMRQFRRETSAAMRDLHNAGRFSKRVAVVYARDAQSYEAVVDGSLQAARALVPHALALLPAQFALDDFIRQLLRLSYLGEQRVAEDSKVDALFVAEADHYRSLYGAILAERGLEPDGGGLYTQSEPDPNVRRRTERLLARSRRRGKMRWPKYIITVDNWLEMSLSKIERHHGIRIELSERERRWPLIFGWPKFLALKRRGLVK